MTEDKDIRFIARHYAPGKFNVKKGWTRMGIDTHTAFWRPLRVAAAIAGVVAISATATFIYHTYTAAPDANIAAPYSHPSVAPELAVKVIDFENAPLTVVAKRINEVYGVDVMNLPPDAENMKLSLHYEGNALELVDTINEILGTQMSIKK